MVLATAAAPHGCPVTEDAPPVKGFLPGGANRTDLGERGDAFERCEEALVPLVLEPVIKKRLEEPMGRFETKKSAEGPLLLLELPF